MVRLLVQFTEAQVKCLRAAQVAQPDRWERARRAIGGFRSGVRDLGEHHDRYLGAGNRW